MKKQILVCLFIMCFFSLSIPKFVFGESPDGQSLAEQVFYNEKYTELFKRPGIQRELPAALRVFNKDQNRNNLNRGLLESFLRAPESLFQADQEFAPDFISLLASDKDLRALFRDEQFYNVLKDSNEIVMLINLIESIQLPTTLEKESGNDQSGAPNTSLADLLVVIVKDQNGEPVAGISVTFEVTWGDGSLSDTTRVTDNNGKAETTLSLGTAPVTLVEASVEGISDKVIFIATTTPTSTSTPTPSPSQTLEIVSGIEQSGNPDAILNPFVVVVKDQDGGLVVGVSVTFEVTWGDGSLSDTTGVTDNNGKAKTTLTLGTDPVTLVEASSEGISDKVIFIATTSTPTPSPSQTLEIVSGIEQSGNPDAILNPFVVVVKDQDGGLVVGVSVTFEVTWGDGRLSNTTGVTDNNGHAETTLTLGTGPGTLVEASVEGISYKVVFFATTIPTPSPPDTNTPKPSELLVNITPSKIVSPAVGKIFILNVNIKGGESINGYEITVEFDSTALKYFKFEGDNDNPAYPAFNGEYLPDAIPLLPLLPLQEIVPGTDESVIKNTVTLAAVSPFTDSSGDGVLARLAFEVVEIKQSTLKLVDVQLSDSEGSLLIPKFDKNLGVEVLAYNADVDKSDEVDMLDLTRVSMCVGVESEVCAAADVNGDKVVNILDLVAVAQAMGAMVISEDTSLVPNPADVNGDGIVNIQDLVLVAFSLGETSPAAPSVRALAQGRVSAADVQIWLTQAKAFNPNISEITKAHPAYQRGIAVLENLLSTLTQAAPQRTALLLNYPNPFNPETWIPYQLAEAMDVNVTIHAMNGSLIRTLSLGHQVAGIYRSKSRAAYWDGKNEFGERVASGIYFYTLTAGNFSATHKMLIRK